MPRTRGARERRPSGTVWLIAALLACARPATLAESAGDTTRVSVTRPTVIAYFIVPPGAVDTMPNLAVEADDWNYAMAMLRDSLEANRIDLAMAVDPFVRIEDGHSSGVVVSLGAALTAGYVFVRPGEVPCVRRGPMEQAALLGVARTLSARPSSPTAAPERWCLAPEPVTR
jgi:hypothetical protein